MKKMFFALSVCAGMNATAAVSESWDLATVRRQTDRAADWQIVHPVTTGRFVHQHTPLYWTMGAFYNGLLDWGLAHPGGRRFVDHVRKIGEEVGWDRQRLPHLVLGHADTHCVCAAWLQLAAEDNVLGERIRAAQECFDALRADPAEYTLEFIRKDPKSKMRWTWADALYMSPPSWVLLAGLTGDRGYLDHMAKEFRATTGKLFNGKARLFYRDSTYLPGGQNWKGRDVFWSRGNGWVFGALAMILRDLPADHADRACFVDLFRRMAEGVAACQQTDGSWHPDLADPKTPDCPEMSGTSFFTYGYLWGMNNGLLDPAVYEPVARKGWAAICRAMNEDGRLGWVQQVGSSPTAELKSDYFEFYATGAYLCAAKELCTWIVRKTHPKCPSVSVTGGKAYEPNHEVRFKKGMVAPGGRVWDVRYGREIDGAFAPSGEYVFKINVLAGQHREFLALDKPLFTAGFMSDTHVDPSPGSCDRVRAAYEFFKAKGVSLIANLGDIADRHYPEAYRAYRQVRETVYSDAASRPREVFLWAHHDRTHFKGRENGDYTEAFEAAKSILGIGHEQIDRFEMGGYTFLIFPQWIDKRLDIFEKNIAEACAANPGKPVFVLNHVPPAETTEGTRGGRNRERRILDKYPQVVVFSGHTHGTLRDERLIWQKGFVNVNLGCLSRWSGNFLGRVPPPVQVWTIGYLEFYRDRLVVRRFSLKDGSEIGADDPWTIRWGVDDGRYAPETRGKVAPEPNFPAGAVPTAMADGDPMRAVNVTWPAAGPDRGILGYRLRIETRGDGGWQTLAVRETCSDFRRETDERAARTFTDCLPAAFFDEGWRYRFSVEPYGFYGKVGARISAEWTAPKKAEADPLCVLDSGLPVLHGGEKFLLPKCVQDMPPQAPMRAIVDAESEHGVDENLSFRIQGYPVKEVVSGWAHTESGKVFRRYVIDFKRGSGKQLIYLAAPFSKPELTLKLMRLRIEK